MPYGIPFLQPQFFRPRQVGGGGSLVAGYTARWAGHFITGLSDGDPVSLWEDESGNGYDGTAADARRPTYKTNIIGGQPVVRFDGLFNRLLVSNLPTSSNRTVFAVCNRTGNDNMFNVVFASGASESFAMLLQFGSSALWGAYTDAPNPAGSNSSSTFEIFTFTKASNSLSFYKDGAADGTATGGSGVFSTTYIGSDEFESALKGDIAELIVYDSVLNGTQISQNVSALASFYSL